MAALPAVCIQRSSPTVNKLLYGWDVNGPLDLHSKGWESASSTQSDKGVVQYVLEMRHHLARHCKEAWGTCAKKTQKTWYGQQARHCDFQHSQKVLLLLLSANTSGKMAMAIH